MLFKDKFKKIIKNNVKLPIKKTVSVTLSVLLMCLATSFERFSLDEVSAEDTYTEVAYQECYIPPDNDIKQTFSGNQSAFTELDEGNYIFDNANFTQQLKIKDNAKVHIWLKGNNKFQGANGANGIFGFYDGTGNFHDDTPGEGGKAAIFLPETAEIYFHGGGSIEAKGGNGGNGTPGRNGYGIYSEDTEKFNSNLLYWLKIAAKHKEKHSNDFNEANYEFCDDGDFDKEYDQQYFCSALAYINCYAKEFAKNDSNKAKKYRSNMLKNFYNRMCQLYTGKLVNGTNSDGSGGCGGGGGGAAIGTNGTNGGKGGKIGTLYKEVSNNKKTQNGGNGGNSDNVIKPGKVYFLNTGAITLTAGSGGSISDPTQGTDNAKRTGGHGMPYNNPYGRHGTQETDPNSLKYQQYDDGSISKIDAFTGGDKNITGSKTDINNSIFNHIDWSSEKKSEDKILFFAHAAIADAFIIKLYSFSPVDGNSYVLNSKLPDLLNHTGFSFGGAGGNGGYGNNAKACGSGGCGGGGGGAGGTGAFHEISGNENFSNWYVSYDYGKYSGSRYVVNSLYNGGHGGGGGASRIKAGEGGGGGGGYIYYNHPLATKAGDTEGDKDDDCKNPYKSKNGEKKHPLRFCVPNFGQGGRFNEDGQSVCAGAYLRESSSDTETDNLYASGKRLIAKGGYAGKSGSTTSGGSGGRNNDKFPDLRLKVSQQNVCDIYGSTGNVFSNFPGGSGGNGGNYGKNDNIECAVYRSERSKYNNGEILENVYDRRLSILTSPDEAKLIAFSEISEDKLDYQWYIIDNNSTTDANTSKELKLTTDLIGKTIQLKSKAKDNASAVGESVVEYKFIPDFSKGNVTVEPRNSSFSIDSNGIYVADFTGNKIDLDLIVKYNGLELNKNEHYNVEYYNNAGIKLDGETLDKALTYPNINGEAITAKIIPIDGKIISSSTNYPEIKLKINSVNVTNAEISPKEHTYTGYNQTQKTDENQNGEFSIIIKREYDILKQGDDYNIEFPDDMKNVETDSETGEIISKKIKIIPNIEKGYSGNRELEYKITPCDINILYLILNSKTFPYEFPFTGEDINPEVTLKYGDIKLEENKDYTIELPEDKKSVGAKTITLRGIGNYTGTRTIDYTIKGKDLNDTDIIKNYSPLTFEYTGKEQKPEISLTKNDTKLLENKAYTVLWPNDMINTGNKEFIINPKAENGYIGTIKQTYKITPVNVNKKIEEGKFELGFEDDVFYYNGKEVIPKIIAKYTDPEKNIERILIKSTDYDIIPSQDNPVGVGEKSINIIFKGNYTGESTLTYTMQKAEAEKTYGENLVIDLKNYVSNTVDKDNLDFYISNYNDLLENASIDAKTNLVISPQAPAGTYDLIVTDKDSKLSIYTTITIHKATPIVSLSNKSKIYNGDETTIDAAKVDLKNGENFDGNIQYNYYSDELCNSLLSELPKNVGTYYAKAYAESLSDNYNSNESNVAKISIKKANQVLTGSTDYGGKPDSSIPINTVSNVSTQLSYYSSDENVVKIDQDGNMKLIGEGTAMVGTYAPETDNYNDAVLLANVKVDKNLKDSYSSDTSSSEYQDKDTDIKDFTSNINSNFSNSKSNSISNISSDDEDSQSESDTKQEENTANEFWNTLTKTGDTTHYSILMVAAVTIALIIIIFIIKKRKK